MRTTSVICRRILLLVTRGVERRRVEYPKTVSGTAIPLMAQDCLLEQMMNSIEGLQLRHRVRLVGQHGLNIGSVVFAAPEDSHTDRGEIRKAHFFERVGALQLCQARLAQRGQHTVYAVYIQSTGF